MSRRRRVLWALGLYGFGIVSVLAFRQVVNDTTLADRLVAPLVLPDTSGPADVIVVPAAGVTGLCTPNRNSLQRALLAVRLYRAGRAPRLFFSGGPPKGQTCSVADVMAAFAREMGVPGDAVQVETASLSTRENAVRSAPTLEVRGARRLLLVTDLLHMRRASGAFLALGFEIERASVPIYEGHRDNVEMLAAGFREYVALAYYQWRGWVGPTRRGSR